MGYPPMNTLALTSTALLDHRAPHYQGTEDHPERPERLSAILDLLKANPVEGVEVREPRLATDAELEKVHSKSLLAQLESTRGRSMVIDPDTATSPGTYDVARRAAGAAVEAVEAVYRGQARNAFALIRPPGHHAEPNRAMGFCFLNNAAIAAEAARALGAERVLILDWDVHHGNGTQACFEARNDVLFMSAHQYPFYPGTGAPHQVGTGLGAGYSVNCALPPDQTDSDYGAVFHDLFLPVANAFHPDVVIVSAGFDAHRHDPIGQMALTELGFAGMCTLARELAEQCCSGKLVMLLEGGYHLEALSQSVHACLEVLTGRSEQLPQSAGPEVTASLSKSKAALRPFWAL